MKLDLTTPGGRAIVIFLGAVAAGPLGIVAAAVGLVLRDLTDKLVRPAR